ncbi:hypothetical protein KUTeg_011266 [Tegillarca granosa]|uniref:Chitin-binding type-2 domain-containing protein n=1 Tax=Tegillarca granosa TaxID=220873 RepID=A0ABQ9F1B1_TEGGR|nr:hypothetical protein KUTeg_011266 [Tegillarca granosa]
MKKPLILIFISLHVYLFGLVFGVNGPGAVTLTEAECAKNCDVSTPNCFFHDNENCRFYRNCYLELGKWKGYVRPCPFGQFWSTKWTVCDYHYNVNCQMDKCRLDSSLAHYTNQHKLTYQKCNRNYWACVKGVSQPRCCREGETYEPNRGCVPSGCLGKCLLGLNDICKYENDGFRFGQGNANCRKYLECKNKIAISRCCPKYHRYEYGHCIPDTNCDKPCGSEIKPVPPISPPVKPVVCPVYKSNRSVQLVRYGVKVRMAATPVYMIRPLNDLH